MMGRKKERNLYGNALPAPKINNYQGASALKIATYMPYIDLIQIVYPRYWTIA